MDKRFGIIVISVILVIFGIFYFGKSKDSTAETNSTNTAAVSNHTKGTGTVSLVEYGDFQCPACGQFYPLVDEVLKKFEGKVTFTFKNNPLDTIHRNARAAHRAAEAAALQGKFFEMYDQLYKNQSTWSEISNPVPVFESYASSLSLDLAKFKTDFASQAVNDTINADLSEGKSKYKVDSTPTFVLNGQVLKNSDIGSLELFTAKLEEAVKATTSN
jgi:protein-disulfide isomerase